MIPQRIERRSHPYQECALPIKLRNLYYTYNIWKFKTIKFRRLFCLFFFLAPSGADPLGRPPMGLNLAGTVISSKLRRKKRKKDWGCCAEMIKNIKTYISFHYIIARASRLELEIWSLKLPILPIKLYSFLK